MPSGEIQPDFLQRVTKWGVDGTYGGFYLWTARRTTSGRAWGVDDRRGSTVTFTAGLDNSTRTRTLGKCRCRFRSASVAHRDGTVWIHSAAREGLVLNFRTQVPDGIEPLNCSDLGHQGMPQRICVRNMSRPSSFRMRSCRWNGGCAGGGLGSFLGFFGEKCVISL